MLVNEFFTFKLGEHVKLKTGQPYANVLMVIEIRIGEGARTGYFTLCDSMGRKYQVTGKELHKIKEGELREDEKFPLPSGCYLAVSV